LIRIAVVLGFVNIMSIFRILALFFRLQYAIFIIAYCNNNISVFLVLELLLKELLLINSSMSQVPHVNRFLKKRERRELLC